MKLFVDSNAFIARALEHDKNHEAAGDVFRELSRRRLPYHLLYTSNFVVDETVTFLLYQAGPRTALAVLEWIRASPQRSNPSRVRRTRTHRGSGVPSLRVVAGFLHGLHDEGADGEGIDRHCILI